MGQLYALTRPERRAMGGWMSFPLYLVQHWSPGLLACFDIIQYKKDSYFCQCWNASPWAHGWVSFPTAQDVFRKWVVLWSGNVGISMVQACDTRYCATTCFISGHAEFTWRSQWPWTSCFLLTLPSLWRFFQHRFPGRNMRSPRCSLSKTQVNLRMFERIWLSGTFLYV